MEKLEKMVFVANPSRKMNWVSAQIKESDGTSASPSATVSLFANPFQKQPLTSSTSTPPSSASKIGPPILFAMAILAVFLLLSSLIRFLFRFLKKHPPTFPPSSSRASRYRGSPGSEALHRQLQQLFHLHDSGLDQASIDSLPVFLYREIMGLKEPFDCAICLCEFSEDDKLRLLPLCSHAFHLGCVDTWLLSNSTCPLCRVVIFAVEGAVFEPEDLREEEGEEGNLEQGLSQSSSPYKSVEIEAAPLPHPGRIFPVRLGKLRSVDGGDGEEGAAAAAGAESSSCNLDARRCYSMGSFHYVLGDSNLQVTLRHPRFLKGEPSAVNSSSAFDPAGSKIWGGRKIDSFSVSKIWLWSRKGKLPDSPIDTQSGASYTFCSPQESKIDE